MAAERRTVEAATLINRNFVLFPVDREIQNWRRSTMPRAKLNLVNFHAADVSGKALVAILFTGCLPALLLAQQPSQKFTSPEEASQALFMAAQNSDQKVLL